MTIDDKIQAQPGDIVLVAHGDEAGPVSRLIRGITGSPYSHTVLALGEQCYVDASPRPDEPDIKRLHEDELKALLVGDRHLLLLRAEQPPDREALVSSSNALIDLASRRRNPAIFSDGALAGIGILIVMQRLFGSDLDRSLGQVAHLSSVDASTEVGLRGRVRAALFHALEDGDRRLFCSEMAHRALDGAGSAIPWPASPVVDLPEDTAVVTDIALSELEAQGLATGLWDWLVDLVLAQFELDRTSITTFIEVYESVRQALKEPPDRVPPTDANFFTPEDFRRIPTHYTAIATTRSSWWSPLP